MSYFIRGVGDDGGDVFEDEEEGTMDRVLGCRMWLVGEGEGERKKERPAAPGGMEVFDG